MADGRIECGARVFSGIPQVPEILALAPSTRRALFGEGVPEYFFYQRYSAEPDLSVIYLDEGTAFVRFGSDCRGMIGVDLAGGHVIHVEDGLRETISFVNKTVVNFTKTVRMLAGQFPYGASLEGFEGSEVAADGICTIIRSADAEAMAPGSYWPGFAHEVAGWLYSMAEILEWHQARPPSLSTARFESSRRTEGRR